VIVQFVTVLETRGLYHHAHCRAYQYSPVPPNGGELSGFYRCRA